MIPLPEADAVRIGKAFEEILAHADSLYVSAKQVDKGTAVHHVHRVAGCVALIRNALVLVGERPSALTRN
jgi:hypothetical protein